MICGHYAPVNLSIWVCCRDSTGRKAFASIRTNSIAKQTERRSSQVFIIAGHVRVTRTRRNRVLFLILIRITSLLYLYLTRVSRLSKLKCLSWSTFGQQYDSLRCQVRVFTLAMRKNVRIFQRSSILALPHPASRQRLMGYLQRHPT